MVNTTPKAIIHLDMDAFYASVEILDDPSLQDKPVIVGGSSKRGVVSSACYRARKWGVHSAQPVAAARRLCPKGVFLPVRMARYKEVSETVFHIFRRFTSLVEPLSIDEAFLDVTGSQRLFGQPSEIAAKIKGVVREETCLTVSAGVATCKFVAKIASDLEKPDGLTVVPGDAVDCFLKPLSIDKLWGVGKATQKALALLGVQTIGDLSRLPRELLERRFGKQGGHLHLLSQGIDDRNVDPFRETKSLGREETFSTDIEDMETIRKELLSLAQKVSARARRKGLSGQTITVKVKYSDFQQVTRSVTLERPTDDGSVLFHESCRLVKKTAAGKRPLRLMGISLSGLQAPSESEQLCLFQNPNHGNRKRLNSALDRIHGKFGEQAILPGTLFGDLVKSQ